MASTRRRALLSVSDKVGLVIFARGLAELGFELLSTGGTAKALEDAGLSVTPVETATGFPEMLGGRVKTLHPAIHGGILARRDLPEDLAAIAAVGIQPIDVVVVNLYPFREAAAKPGVEFEELIENIDIGGPSLLRAAAKNHRHVVVLCDPADYPNALEALRSGEVAPELRYRLMLKVFAHTAAYDAAIAQRFSSLDHEGHVRAAPPAFLGLMAQRRSTLRYGENPHQSAAWYVPDPAPGQAPWLAAAQVLQGKELSYNNLLDLHAAASCLREFRDLAAVIVKHNTPCGVATGLSLEAAYRAARAADETSAFGGIVAVNGEVDGVVAATLAETFLEAVIAPGFSSEAQAMLATKKNLRLLTLPSLDRSVPRTTSAPRELRSLGDSFLLQEADVLADAATEFVSVARRSPTDDERRALLFAWAVVRHVRSNAIVFSTTDRTLGIGGGQTSRVEAVELAARKAMAGTLRGSAVASDAFFPFRDGLDAAARAGASCVIQPGGSVRDAEVIAAADANGMAMLFTGQRHFRH